MAAKNQPELRPGAALAWVGQRFEVQQELNFHQECEILLCCGGESTVTLGEGKYVLRTGDGIFVASCQQHAIASGKDSVLLDALMDQRLLRNIVSGSTLACPVFADNYCAQDTMRQICRELEEKQLFYADCVNALTIQLVARIFRGEALSAVKLSSANKQAQILALVKMIDEQHEFLTFTEAAAAMNMSEAYFSRYFKKCFGITFSQYLNLVKVSHAVSVIHANPDISNVDLMICCGFNSLRHLQRVFMAVTGYSPKRLPSDFSINIKDYTAQRERFDPASSAFILTK